MHKFKKKAALNGDVLVVDSVRYSVDTLQMLPQELKPRQFSQKSDGTHLVFGAFIVIVNLLQTGTQVNCATEVIRLEV